MKFKIATMKTFGPSEVLEFAEKELPVLAAGDFLVKGQFASVSTADVRIRSKNIPRGFQFLSSLIFGFKKPRFETLGTDYVGVISQVGESVSEVKVGNRIVLDSGAQLNCYSTYRLIQSKDVWAKVPESVSSEAAVGAVFGGLTALIFLRDKLKVQPKDKILIIGAGGAVGSSAVQIAKYFGAEVTGVCSLEKSDVVKTLGAVKTVDYRDQKAMSELKEFDLVLDCIGSLDISSSRKLLKAKGKVGFVVADLMLNLKCLLPSIFNQQQLISGTVQGKREDLQFLMKLISEGNFKPLIGRKYPFSDVIEAHREVESGHRLGTTLLVFE